VTSPNIGTLAWVPASTRPDLVAAPVAAALRGPAAAFADSVHVAAIDPELADTAAFCDSYAVPLEVSANCVVVAGRRAEVTTYAACLVLATTRADVNKTVRKHLDVRKISFAPMAEAVARTGMEYGGITPVGLPADWPLLVDAQVAAAPWVIVGSGIRGSKLLLRGASLPSLPATTVLDLAVSAAG
jgi:prolyl-tRNA editing enzyme YbaK/EbsC (Cys-tRNA(Pro) deacylase)